MSKGPLLSNSNNGINIGYIFGTNETHTMVAFALFVDFVCFVVKRRFFLHFSNSIDY